MLCHSQKKRHAFRREILGDNVTVQAFGYVDTTQDAVLTSDAVMQAARKHAVDQFRKSNSQQLAASRRLLAIERKNEA